MKTIFVVTTIRSPHNMRTVGWFPNIEDATLAVIDNHYDIWEFSYWFCVIEEVRSGFYPIPVENEWWYGYSEDDNGYVIIEKPDLFKNVSNFGIG